MSVGGAILLDAMGTLLRFDDPAPRLQALIARRHGVRVSEAAAEAAMRAEIALYRREHDRAVDAASLAALRRDCAHVIGEALGIEVDLDALAATLVEAIVFEPYPETAAVLDALRARGHTLAVVSNWDVSLHDVLQRTGLAERVDAVAISALVGAAKPSPVPFAHALAQLGAAAADAVHVGDTYGEDVVGARAAGVRPILVARDGAGAAAHPDVEVIADLRGLLALP